MSGKLRGFCQMVQRCGVANPKAPWWWAGRADPSPPPQLNQPLATLFGIRPWVDVQAVPDTDLFLIWDFVGEVGLGPISTWRSALGRLGLGNTSGPYKKIVNKKKWDLMLFFFGGNPKELALYRSLF